MRYCVQVKNKPCTRRPGYMRLISWIHPRGSGTSSIGGAKDGGDEGWVGTNFHGKYEQKLLYSFARK
jgi:hypothetical protein